MKAYEVAVCLRLTVTVRVDADSEDAAEERANELASEAVAEMPNLLVGVDVTEDDRSVHSIRVAKADCDA